ncbi:putative C6 transcription protein [Neofusicoccum parvum]|nr:putative C6 transcription protein [Neofusicoccum parvum]
MITERCEDEYTPSPGPNPHPPPEPSDVFWQTDHRSFEPLIYAPPARQIPWYWEKFIELVDPFVKILHIPTTAPLFLNFNASATPVDTQPLFFAICYSVACSLPPSACATVLQDDQRALIVKYKTATQRALGAARFLATQELRVLQALVLLMSCAGGSEAEELWTLTGLVLRVAQHMGLHRDGGRHFAALVSPFAAEMRRRAWWHICVLDLQVSEVRGAESTVLDLAFDTRMPANVRDEDVAPEMEALPAARKGCTAVTGSLISFEVVEVLRKMARAAKKGAAGCSAVTFQQKVGILDDFTAKVEDEYLAHGVKRDGPLFHCCRALFRCLRARLLLLLYRPFRQPGRNAHLSQDAKDTLFLACLEALESWHFLSADPRFTARSTGFRANVLFQVLIFVLLQLCGGRNDALAERAWHMVMAAQLPPPDRSLEPRMRRIIGPGSRLLERAKRSRELQLQQRSSEAEFNDHLHPITTPTTAVRSSAAGSTQGSGEGADAHAPPGGFDTLSADLAAFVEEFPGSYFMDIM